MDWNGRTEGRHQWSNGPRAGCGRGAVASFARLVRIGEREKNDTNNRRSCTDANRNELLGADGGRVIIVLASEHRRSEVAGADVRYRGRNVQTRRIEVVAGGVETRPFDGADAKPDGPDAERNVAANHPAIRGAGVRRLLPLIRGCSFRSSR